MRITVSFELDDESKADPTDPTGLTEPAFIELNEALIEFGADDIDVTREDQ